MEKLLIKTSFFVIPFFLIFIIKESFYAKDKGDLLRLGYVFDTNSYNRDSIFKKYNKRNLLYTQVSKTNLDSVATYDFISIGDSFSAQGQIGYQNCLVHKTKIKLLDIDRDIYYSPIQGLYDLINGGFFVKNKTKYVILQNVERGFVERGRSISKTDKFTIDSLKQIFINKEKSEKEHKKNPNDQFFSKENIRFIMYNFNYLFDDNANVSPTYKVNTSKNLFSVSDHKLLFFEDDIKVLKSNNDKLLIENLNNELNFLSDKLAKLNIKLIVLPSPDKYSVYYNYIVNKEEYEKPIFFDYFNTLKKKYIYINSKDILSRAIKNQKDVYFYDDTHWSPIASELIASEISGLCKLTK
jgi:hypothetical protein